MEGLYSYGPLVEAVEASTLTGESKKVPMVNLSSLLQGLFQDSNYFFELLTHAHALNPSSFERPWRGILYADELHPGNQLSSTTRKTWIIYFSWLELTPKLLSDEKHWFTLMVIRSHETAEIEAGISQLTRLLLERMFHHDHGTPLAGILLKNGDNLSNCIGLWAFICKMMVPLKDKLGPTDRIQDQDFASCAKMYFL